MLCILFSIGQNRYALPVAVVREVTPLVKLKDMLGTPNYVSGMLNLREQLIPVIDLVMLATQQTARESTTTRILITTFTGADLSEHPLGLIVENVTETRQLDPKSFRASPIHSDSAPFLGDISIQPQEQLQLISVDRILSPEISAALFRTTGALP